MKRLIIKSLCKNRLNTTPKLLIFLLKIAPKKGYSLILKIIERI